MALKNLNEGGRMATSTRRTLSASSLIGDKVKNDAGEDLGSVKEIMLDTVTGKVAYVVVSFGGIMGIGDKLLAIPFQKFTLDEANDEFNLHVDKETLESAPGFDADHWPDFAKTDFNERIQKHYNTRTL